MSGLVDVALPLPVQAPFTYRLPGRAPTPERGVRVVVPFGSRRVIGVVAGPARPRAGLVLKDVVQVLDESPLVLPPLLDLAAWMAEHYLAPPGECYRLVLPPAGIRASKAVVRLARAEEGGDEIVEWLRERALPVSTIARRLGRDPSARLARLRREGRIVVEQDLRAPGFLELQIAVLVAGDPTPRGSAQAEVVRRLREAGGRARVADLVRERPSLRSAIGRLAERREVRLETERDVRAPEGLPPREAVPLEPSPDQKRALGPLNEAVQSGGFAPFLLHGITGSGKTEVYFRAVEEALRHGRGAILLVPEIALTPLLVRAASARFGGTVAVQHSELSAG